MKYSNELTHWGVKGMKWGVRRYQNKDGTLTNAGQKRYSRDAREKGYKSYDADSGVYYKSNKKGKRSELESDANRYVKEDLHRTKNLTDSSNNLVRNLENINNSRIKDTPRKKVDLSNMSDQELRDRINRANLERQYNDMFNAPQVPKGREYAAKVLKYGGEALTVAGSAVGLALAIKELSDK